jgi:hypothetical protein
MFPYHSYELIKLIMEERQRAAGRRRNPRLRQRHLEPAAQPRHKEREAE